MVKVVNIASEMQKWVEHTLNFKHPTLGCDVYPANALDPTDSRYLVPELTEKIINELEAQGWEYVEQIRGAGLLFRNFTDLRAIARDLQAKGKI